MSTILVTGGCGFIGSHFVRHLLEVEPDARIVNVDKLTYAGNEANLQGVEEQFGERYRFVRGDIADVDFIHPLFEEEQPDYVANLAAESHVDRSILDTQTFLDTNVYGVVVLLEAARRFRVEGFLQVSTDEVYGVADDNRAFLETDRLAPRSPYAASKASGEVLAHAYFVTHGVPVVVARGSNAYGPYQHPEKLIPRSVTNLLLGRRIQIYGDGRHRREWAHVTDHARALHVVMRRGTPGEIYNFGSGEERENMQVADRLIGTLGKDESWIEYVKDRLGHDRRYRVDSAKIRALGWQPTVDFDQALHDTVDWYVANRDWWEPLRDRDDYQAYEQQIYREEATSPARTGIGPEQ